MRKKRKKHSHQQKNQKNLQKIRKRITIINWIEELSADRFAFDIYNDKETFETCLNYKKKKWKSTSSSISHPSWEIRYEFIHNNIPVIYDEVEKYYNKWKRNKINTKKVKR